MINRIVYLILIVALGPGALAAQTNSDSTLSNADTSSVSLLTPPTQAVLPADNSAGDTPTPPQAELPSALRGLKVGTTTYIRYEYM